MAGPVAVWLRRGGAVLAVVLVVAAAVTVLGALRSGFGDERRQSRELAPGVAVLSLDLGASDVEVRSGPGDRIALTRLVRGSPEISEEVDADTATVSSRCPALNLGRCSIDYEIVVPRGVRVVAKSGAGDVTVHGVADVEVEASSGNVRVSGPSDRARLTTASGDVTVSGGSARLDLRARSGDVRATGLTARRVTATTGSGDVEVAFTRAPTTVHASADSGDATVRVPGGASYRVDAVTDSGDRTVEVPTDKAAERSITASTDSGDVTVRPG